MLITPQLFLPVAHGAFDYLQQEFGFTSADQIGKGWVQSAQVVYDSPKVVVTPSWNSRDGVAVGIGAKEDTFWIRPSSSQSFDVQELIGIVAPDALKQAPPVPWEETTNLKAWLGFFAGQLRVHATALLRGDLSLCEDMLIMRYCNSSKGLPPEEYHKVFRESCSTLSLEDRRELEAAIASGSPRRLGFLLNGWVQEGRVQGGGILTALNDFWLQHFQ